MNLDVSSPEATFVVPLSCCKKNITDIICKQSVKFKVGESRLDSPSIYSKV